MNTEFQSQLDNFLNEVNEYRKESFIRSGYSQTPAPVEVDGSGRKYLKLTDGRGVWGFVSLVEGLNKGSRVRVGDLLKAASWRSPAKHSRGNILDGTASYDTYGPNYLRG